MLKCENLSSRNSTNLAFSKIWAKETHPWCNASVFPRLVIASSPTEMVVIRMQWSQLFCGLLNIGRIQMWQRSWSICYIWWTMLPGYWEATVWFPIEAKIFWDHNLFDSLLHLMDNVTSKLKIFEDMHSTFTGECYSDQLSWCSSRVMIVRGQGLISHWHTQTFFQTVSHLRPTVI